MLSKEGIQYGHARLAVQVEAIGDQEGCVYCAMCLYGCPRKLIYNSGQTIEMLRGGRDFICPDVIVDRIAEDEKETTLSVPPSVQSVAVYSSRRTRISCRGCPRDGKNYPGLCRGSRSPTNDQEQSILFAAFATSEAHDGSRTRVPAYPFSGIS